MAKKEKLIDKLKKRDYNNDLEEVLSKKDYKEDVKNLLLDIFYKIEMSYKDYETVKRNVLPMEEFMERLIKGIKNNCDSIEFIRPNKNEKKTFLVDSQNKKIQCYPIARKLLYCLAKIQKKDDIVKQGTDILNKALTNTINVGNNINTVEPLRDFTGYAWSISPLDIENFYYNLVYQDLIILVGNKLLESWVSYNDNMVDYIELFRIELEKLYENKLAKEIMELLKQISVLLEAYTDKEFKKENLKRKSNIETELKAMENKEKYLDDLSKNKKKITRKIKEIDIIISDKEKLADEYKKRNQKVSMEEKIFSKRVLALKLMEERDELISELQKNNDKMNSKQFLKRQRDLKEEKKYLELIDVKSAENEALERMILLQKCVLRALKIKIKQANTRENLNKILYEIRYLNLIPITKTQNIGQVPKLKKMRTMTEYEALIKGYELRDFNNICKDKNLSAKILKYIFHLNIMKLEDISLKIVKEDDSMYVQFYDDDIADEKFKLDFDLKKEDLKIKFNKKIRVFDL